MGGPTWGSVSLLFDVEDNDSKGGALLGWLQESRMICVLIPKFYTWSQFGHTACPKEVYLNATELSITTHVNILCPRQNMRFKQD